MFKVDLPRDTREREAIVRRRNAEEDRKQRIFNPKPRIIGVDEPALRNQVHTRKAMEQEDHDIHQAVAAEMVRHDEICCLLELRQQRDLLRANKELNEFRRQMQHKATRKEWDLSDPMALKNDLPARTSDSDERCGVASMQMFVGEDLAQPERKKMQTTEMKIWLTQQMQEKQQRQAQEDRNERLYMLRQAEIEARIEELEQLRLKTVRDIRMKQNDFNTELSEIKKQSRAHALEQERREKQQELENNIYGDFLTENPHMADSCFGPHRVRVDYWKGMNDQQLGAIRLAQEQQREENARKREQENHQELLNGEYAEGIDRMAELTERKQNRDRRQIDKQRVNFNRTLSKEQTERNRFRLINEHGEEYFAKFNTTSR